MCLTPIGLFSLLGSAIADAELQNKEGNDERPSDEFQDDINALTPAINQAEKFDAFYEQREHHEAP